MGNHPNRSKHRARRNPTPAQIKLLRQEAGLSVSQAADLVRTVRQTWHRWENPEEKASMHPGLWELFQIKVAVILRRQVDVVLPENLGRR